MRLIQAPTSRVEVFIAGELSQARAALREFCEEGLCVTVEPTTFVYTRGAEEGVRVGLVNYPRFPTTTKKLENTAVRLAQFLLERLFQDSALVVGPVETTWLTRRKESQ